MCILIHLDFNSTAVCYYIGQYLTSQRRQNCFEVNYRLAPLLNMIALCTDLVSTRVLLEMPIFYAESSELGISVPLALLVNSNVHCLIGVSE